MYTPRGKPDLCKWQRGETFKLNKWFSLKVEPAQGSPMQRAEPWQGWGRGRALCSPCSMGFSKEKCPACNLEMPSNSSGNGRGTSGWRMPDALPVHPSTQAGTHGGEERLSSSRCSAGTLSWAQYESERFISQVFHPGGEATAALTLMWN